MILMTINHLVGKQIFFIEYSWLLFAEFVMSAYDKTSGQFVRKKSIWLIH